MEGKTCGSLRSSAREPHQVEGETYTNDVRLMAVNIDFTSALFLPFVNK